MGIANSNNYSTISRIQFLSKYETDFSLFEWFYPNFSNQFLGDDSLRSEDISPRKPVNYMNNSIRYTFKNTYINTYQNNTLLGANKTT